MRGRRGCRFRLLLLTRRRGGERSRRNMRCNLPRRYVTRWLWSRTDDRLVPRYCWLARSRRWLLNVQIRRGPFRRIWRFSRNISAWQPFQFGCALGRRLSARTSRRTAGRPGRFHSQEVWWSGSPARTRCIWRSPRKNIRVWRTHARFHQIGR